MVHANLLSRRSGLETSHFLSQEQLQLDATLHHFASEASNPVAIASMTLGSLAFQGSRSLLLGLGLSRNPVINNIFTYAGALANEVTVFRASNNLLNNIFKSPHTPLYQRRNTGGIFSSEWFGTALDFSLLKFAGAATGAQNIFLRHATQDFAMVSGHELGAHLGWTPPESGTFIEKLFRAEATNLSMIAGNGLGHFLSGGRAQILEKSFALRNEISIQGFPAEHTGRIEPRENEILPRMASDSTTVPAPVRIKLTPQFEESPAKWAERLVEHIYEKPETNALHAITQLHDRVKVAETCEHALETIREIRELTRLTPEGENLLVQEYTVEGLEKPLLIVSLPTTFLPEAWSQTFVEGMAKDHVAQPRERDLAIEVGSGTGFVAIAMAKLGIAQRIIATDKNYHAPLIGSLNAAINGVENIEFQKGDLLADIPEGTQADLIVGCLPQMPRTTPNEAIGLRDLADYAANRGVFEDQLGLGLNATVIQQSKTRLSPQGRIRLMMAQRPGLNAVRDLFRVQGFSPRIIHTTFIQQDPSTDFAALKTIEEERAFHFDFRTRESAQISATDALQLSRDEIFHYLHLVEATPFDQLMRRSLGALAEEKTPWTYTEDAGSENPFLLEQARLYLEGYWGVDIDPRTLFIAPSHTALLDNALRLNLQRGDRVAVAGALDEASERLLHNHSIARENFPENLAELADAIERTPPKALVFRLPRQILRSKEDLERIFASAIHHNIFLVFIEHEGGMVDCEGRVLADLLAKYPQALAQSLIIHPLDTLFQIPTLPLAIGIIPEKSLYENMVRMGDVTYSRSSSLLQAAYAKFLAQPEIQERIRVQGPHHRRRITVDRWAQAPQTFLRTSLSNAPIFVSSPHRSHHDPIDMSFGQSEWLPALKPDFAYARALQNPRLEEVAAALVHHVSETRGIGIDPTNIVLGYGVHPLIQATIRAIQSLHPKDRIEVVLPDPSYGLFEATAWAAGAEVRHVLTRAGKDFLLEPERLREIPRRENTRRALLLNVPTNPPGKYYRPADLGFLADEVDYLLLDEVFAGLDFRVPWRSPHFSNPLREKVVTFGGLAKEVAMGGLRFGYASTTNHELQKALARENLLAPDPIAVEVALETFKHWDSMLPQHREYLSERAHKLEAFFARHHIDYATSQGGFSMFVNLSHLLDGRHRFHGTVLNSQNFHELLMQHAGIKIKSDVWAQMPGHYRFVFSIDRLEEAVTRMERFWAEIEGP